MKASKRQIGTVYWAVLAFLISFAESCSRSEETEHSNDPGGSSSGTGGSFTEGATGGPAGTGPAGGKGGAGGGSTEGAAGGFAGTGPAGGKGGAGGVSGSGTGGGLADGGSTDGGSTDGGSTDGGSASDTGGADSCIDVCELYGPACCVWPRGCIEPGGSCVVEVLSAGTGTTLAYEYADLEQRIASENPEVVTSFTDADIAWAAADPPAASRIEMHMTPEASSLQGTVMENTGGYFRFSCNGRSLFVGVFYAMIGAAAIRTPVLHLARDTENSVVLRLGAWQGAWMSGASDLDPEARERIDRPELRAVFCLRGALRELDPIAWRPDS